MKQVNSLIVFFLLSFSIASAGTSDEFFSPACGLMLSTRVRVVEPPQGDVKADIVYLHGFGDRADHHTPLFDKWAQVGMRTIAMDLPSHGLSRGLSLDFFSFKRLGRMTVDLIQTYRTPGKPLFVAGWSTGALLVMRMIQTGQIKSEELNGVVLFAPALSVKNVVGRWGMLTAQTLTQNPNPPHVSPPYPASPFFRPVFALNLKLNSWLADWDKWPSSLPVQVILAGEHDHYIHSQATFDWFNNQKDELVDFEIRQYPHAFHELDNEPHPTGPHVREASTDWLVGRVEPSF